MAIPTNIQIKTLETIHKKMFVDLVVANRLWIGMLNKVKGLPKTDKRYIAMLDYGKLIAKLFGKWYARQQQLEKAKIPPFPKELVALFLVPDKAAQLEKQALAYIQDKKLPDKLGIVPLLVWGAVAVAGLFTAAFIVDQINTTAAEKVELLKQTEITLKALNVTPEQAGKIIAETQQQASEPSGGGGLFGGGIIKPIGIGIGLYFLFQAINKNQTKKAA